MLKLVFPNKSHKEMWKKMISEWDWRKAPEDLFVDEYESFLDLIIKDLEWRDWRVSSHLFFMFDDNIDDEIIWVIQLRHKIPLIKTSLGAIEEIWHIWYGISTKYRWRWYATKMLKLWLETIKELWLDIDKVLITCDTDNIASARVIEKNWWFFEKINTRGKRKYRINL